MRELYLRLGVSASLPTPFSVRMDTTRSTYRYYEAPLFMDVKHVPVRADGSHNSQDGADVADRLVQNRQAERQLVFGGGQRWCHPQDSAHAGELEDVHVQTEFEAAPG